MSVKKKLLPALIAGALTLGAAGAEAVPFSGVYVFGDSLSDSGYFRPVLVASGLTSAQAAGLGRFTTNPGPVWSEIIAQYYGGNANPSNAGGGIYAQGGARVATDSSATPTGSKQRPVSVQIGEYLTANGNGADPNALYAVWGGANDIFQSFAGIAGGTINGSTFVGTLATQEIQQIGRLRAAGARYIMVFNLPDLGATPQFSPTNPAVGAAGSAAATQLSAGYNTNLFAGLQQAGIKVIPVDVFTLFNDVRANAAAFGFTNTTGMACGLFPPFTTTTPSSQFCNQTNLVSATAGSTYLFADSVHPTSGVHAILGDFVKSLIDGPNAYSTMAEVPLSSRAAHIRTLDEGIRLGQEAPVGKITAFAGAEGSRFDLSTTSLNPQTDTKNRAVTVGVTMRISEGATLGAGLGNTKGEANMNGVGRFDVDENALSLFGNFKSGGLYANFTGSVADLRFKNVQRYVKLGTVTRTATSNTKGSNGSLSAAVGYDFSLGRFQVGPFASFTSQNVTVNAFTENGAGSANLNIMEQQRISRVVSGGVRASMSFGAWTPFVRISADRENNNVDRFVSANPVSVVTGNVYDIPGYKGDGSWVTGTVGVRGKLADRLGLSVVYSAVSSRSNVKQDGITAALSYDF